MCEGRVAALLSKAAHAQWAKIGALTVLSTLQFVLPNIRYFFLFSLKT
jgi:hypothetical protein